MANKIVSLLLQVKNAISPGVKTATKDLTALEERTRSLEKELNRLENAKAAAKGLDAARDAARQAESAFDSAQLEVIRLKAALKSEKTPELALALEKASTSARSAKKEWQDSAKAVGQLETSVKSAGGDLNYLGDTQLKLGQQIDRTSGALRSNKQQLDKARTGLSQTADAAEKTGFSFGSLVAKAGALLGIVTIVSKVRSGMNSLARSVYQTGTEFELLGKRLDAAELGYVEEFTRNTPFQLDQVSEAFFKLRTFGLDPTNGSLQALVDTTADLGGGQQELEGIVSAVGKAWSKEKLQGQEILQMIERGIPVWELLSEKIGKTVPELQAMSAAGQLGRKEIQLLIDAMGERNMGAAQTQMETMAGLVSNLQDRFTQFYRKIADAGVWDYVKKQLQDLGNWFDDMARNGQLDKLAKSISDGFIATAETLKSFVLRLNNLRGEIGFLAKAWLALKITTWAQQLGSAARGFTILKGSVASTTGALGGMAVAAKAAMGAFVLAQIYNVVTAYRDLKVAVAELDATQQNQQDMAGELAARFRQISESTGVVVTSMAELDRAVVAGSIVIDEQGGRYLSAAQAVEAYAQRIQSTSDAQEQQTISAAQLSDAYQGVNAALKVAVSDHSKLAGVMQGEVLKALNGGVEGVGGFALALKSAQQQGELTAEQIETELVAAIGKLSEPEQQRFGALLERAMKQVESGADSAGLSVRELQQMLDAVNTSRAEAAFQRLGIAAEDLTGGISRGFQESMDDLAVLTDQIQKMGPDAKNAGQAVFTALTTAFKNIKTEADKTAFDTQLIEFQKAGLITYQQMEELRGSLSGVADAAVQAGDAGAAGMGKIGAALSEVAEAAERSSSDVKGVAQDLAAFFNNTRNGIRALSDAAVAAFDNRLGIGAAADDMDDLTRAIAQARTELGLIAIDNLKVFDPTGLNRFKNAVLEAKNETIIAYTEQQQQLERYLAALASGENISQGLVNQAQNAIRNMNLLGDQDLSQLRSALDDAQRKLEGISDAATSTLNQLQNELDRLQGNQDAINQRDYENKRKELVDAIEDARRIGNQSAVQQYTDALRVLEEVRRERQKQAAEQRQQQAQQRSAANNTGSNSNSAPARGTTINLQSATGSQSVQLNGDDKAVEQLLAVLEDAGLRSSSGY